MGQARRGNVEIRTFKRLDQALMGDQGAPFLSTAAARSSSEAPAVGPPKILLVLRKYSLNDRLARTRTRSSSGHPQGCGARALFFPRPFLNPAASRSSIPSWITGAADPSKNPT